VKLSKVIEIWEELHQKDTGEIGYCDLEKAIESVDGIENDMTSEQPKEAEKEH